MYFLYWWKVYLFLNWLVCVLVGLILFIRVVLLYKIYHLFGSLIFTSWSVFILLGTCCMVLCGVSWGRRWEILSPFQLLAFGLPPPFHWVIYMLYPHLRDKKIRLMRFPYIYQRGTLERPIRSQLILHILSLPKLPQISCINTTDTSNCSLVTE